MTKMKDFFKRIFENIKSFVLKIGNYIATGFSWFGSKILAPVFNPIKRFLGKIFKPLADKFNDIIDHRRRKALWGIIFLLPLIIGFIFFFLIPLVMTVIYSFSYVNNSHPEIPGLVTRSVGLLNYKYIFTEHPTFTETLVASILDIVLDVPIILIFSLLMAVILNTKFKARALVRGIFFMPVIFNSQAIDVAMAATEALSTSVDATTADLFSSMFNLQDFLVNAQIPPTFIGYLGAATEKIYDIISYSGVQILIFLAGIQAVPKHLYEAAKIEGATQYEIFWKITFPMVSPLMLTAGVYTVVDAFLRSPILPLLKNYDKPGALEGMEWSYYGVHSAMALIYSVAALLVLGIVMFLISRMVFYYDE